MLEKEHGDPTKASRIGFVASKETASVVSEVHQISISNVMSKLFSKVHSEEDSDLVSAMVAPTAAPPTPAMEAEEKAKEERVCKRLWKPTSTTLLPFRLKENIQWWIKAKAPTPVLNLIKHGVLPDWLEPNLTVYPCHRSAKEEAGALALMEDYMDCGAARLLSKTDLKLHPSKFLIPWFLIVKEDKSRLIADCRTLNKFLHPPHFRLDNWGEIFPYLRKGMWGAKVDLKHAYFHLKNSEKLLPYMRINIGNSIFQFESAVFGLNVLPQLFMMVMKAFKKIGERRAT